MYKLITPLAVLLASASLAHAATPTTAKKSPNRVLHENLIVLDTHFDTPANVAVPGFDIMKRNSLDTGSQVDVPRMIEGGVDGGFFAIFTAQGPTGTEGNNAARDAALQRAVVIHEMIAAHPDVFELATKAEDAERISKAGKRFVFISMENSAAIANDLTLMKTFYGLGVRVMGPIHGRNNDLGDSATDPAGPVNGGLTPLGKQFVAEANRLGILLDASHASEQVLDQMLDLSTTPILLTHSGSRAVFDHPRNVSDAMLKKLAAKGGVVQINAFSAYMVAIPKIPERDAALAELRKTYGSELRNLPADKIAAYKAARQAIDAKWPIPRATIDDLVKHILHVAQVAGKDHIGISGDFDGGGGLTGFDDVTDFPALTDRLIAAGFTKDDLAKFWGGNALRVLKAADEAKAK